MLKVTVGHFRKLQLLPYLKDNTLLTLSRKLHQCQKPITSLWTLSFLTVLFKLKLRSPANKPIRGMNHVQLCRDIRNTNEKSLFYCCLIWP